MAATALSQRARSPSLNSFSVFTAILAAELITKPGACVASREGGNSSRPAKALAFITGPSVAFGIPASVWRTFFLAALVLSQRGWNFPGGQEFLSRGRGFLEASRRGARPVCRNFCRRHPR